MWRKILLTLRLFLHISIRNKGNGQISLCLVVFFLVLFWYMELCNGSYLNIMLKSYWLIVFLWTPNAGGEELARLTNIVTVLNNIPKLIKQTKISPSPVFWWAYGIHPTNRKILACISGWVNGNLGSESLWFNLQFEKSVHARHFISNTIGHKLFAWHLLCIRCPSLVTG